MVIKSKFNKNNASSRTQAYWVLSKECYNKKHETHCVRVRGLKNNTNSTYSTRTQTTHSISKNIMRQSGTVSVKWICY